MNRKILLTLLIIGTIFTLTLSGCAPKEDPLQAEAQKTYVAQTVAVQFTKTAIARPSDTPVPTNTPIPSPTPQPTVEATATSAVPTAAVGTTEVEETATSLPPSGGTDAGVWVRSDPVDGASISAGGKFNVVVTLMNIGTTTWTTDYYIQFTGGDAMGSATKINMPYEVPPQMSVQFTMEFTAPTTTGTVRSDWSIVNPNNVGIGIFWFEYTII
jgi:hypothetical protein